MAKKREEQDVEVSGWAIIAVLISFCVGRYGFPSVEERHYTVESVVHTYHADLGSLYRQPMFTGQVTAKGVHVAEVCTIAYIETGPDPLYCSCAVRP